MDKRKVDISVLLYYSFVVFIGVYYVLPEAFRNVAEYIISIIGYLSWCLSKRAHSMKKEEMHIFFMCIVLIGLTVFQVVSPNGGNNALICTGELLGCFTYSKYYDKYSLCYIKRKKRTALRILIYLMTIGLIYCLFIRVRAIVTSSISVTDIFYVLGRDKNMLGVLAFSYFAFCLKLKFRVGYLVSFFLLLFCGSRMYFLAIFCTLSLLAYTRIEGKIRISDCGRLNAIERFLNFSFKSNRYLMLSIIVVGMFSLGFVNWCQLHGYKQYMSSLVDGSNYMRMVANVYAIKRIIQEPSFLFYGLDSNIFNVLGIADSDMAFHTQYMGIRLVTPHNDIFHMIMRSGVAYTFFYWYILSCTIRKFINSNNTYILVPIAFIYSWLLRPILCRGELVVLIFILSISIFKKNVTANPIKSDINEIHVLN